jgi:hypothetical protein
MGAFVIVQSQADLFEVISALQASGGFAGRLHGWQQQADENTDDGDDDQKFDQGESRVAD